MHHIAVEILPCTGTNHAKQNCNFCPDGALAENEDRKNADSVVNVASEANIDLFKKMIQEGNDMCEELKELLAPEIVEFKILLAEQNAQLTDKDAKLADKDAEIAKLKKMLAEAGIPADTETL